MNNKDLVSKSLDKVSRNLARLDSVKKYGEDEAGTLAHDFTDLEKSFLLILENLFPKLLDETLTPNELEDVLFDIGDEFRHIGYHLGNSNFYGYIGVSTPELAKE